MLSALLDRFRPLLVPLAFVALAAAVVARDVAADRAQAIDRGHDASAIWLPGPR